VLVLVLGVMATVAPREDVPPPVPIGGYGTFLLESLLILALVCALAWIVIRFGLRRLQPGLGGEAGGKGAPLRVVARLPLEPRRTLFIVEAAGKALLVGTTDQGPMATLAELDPAAVHAAEASAPPRRSFLELLRRKPPEAGAKG